MYIYINVYIYIYYIHIILITHCLITEYPSLEVLTKGESLHLFEKLLN